MIVMRLMTIISIMTIITYLWVIFAEFTDDVSVGALEDLLGRLHLLHADRALQQVPQPTRLVGAWNKTWQKVGVDFSLHISPVRRQRASSRSSTSKYSSS